MARPRRNSPTNEAVRSDKSPQDWSAVIWIAAVTPLLQDLAEAGTANRDKMSKMKTSEHEELNQRARNGILRGAMASCASPTGASPPVSAASRASSSALSAGVDRGARRRAKSAAARPAPRTSAGLSHKSSVSGLNGGLRRMKSP